MSYAIENNILEILKRGEYTTLAITDGNEPYALTLYYGYDPDGTILYFCTEKKGTKLDFLKSNPYVCGTIIIRDPESEKDVYYHSLIYRGLLEVIHKEDEKKRALSAVEHHNHFSIEISRLKTPMLMKLIIDESEIREWVSMYPVL